MNASDLIRKARALSGDSCRTIASKAERAFSTVHRAELGKTDPTVGTVISIITSCDLNLAMKAIPNGIPDTQRLEDLADAWRCRGDELELDWTRWRGWLDALGQHPDRIFDAIYPIPSTSGNATIDSLLAAIAEKLADDHELPRPSWTAAVPSAHPTYEPPALRRGMSAPQLRARNLLIETESLFRPSLFDG